MNENILPSTISEIIDEDEYQLIHFSKSKIIYKFHETYLNLIEREQKKTGYEDAITAVCCTIQKHPCIVFSLNKKFFMGTIGLAEGEKITQVFEFANEKKMPVISIVASGGIRVHEGTLALMQMAKMVAAVEKHQKNELYVSVLANPVLGGTSASFVSLADIIIMQKDAIYGFTGKRVIQSITKEQLPDDFQSANFVKNHGMVDIVAEKKDLRYLLGRLLQMHAH